MEIKDIQPNQGKIDVVVEVRAKDAPRTFEKFGKKGKVCNCKVGDETGEVTLTLWNDDIDKVNIGDRVHVQNGWCSEYKGEKQISTGKFGKIEVVQAAIASQVFTNDPAMFQQQENVGAGDAESTEEETFDEEELVE